MMEERVITKKNVLLVEGKDEENFFKALLEHLKLNDIDIRDVGGKEKFKNQFPALVKTSGFDNVVSIAIIRDADTNARDTFKSICGIIKKTGFKPPSTPYVFLKGIPRIGIYLSPAKNKSGMLEDLCLETVRDHPAMNCVKNFIECVRSLDKPPKNLQKASSQAFLAAMPEIANSVGVGAQKGYWKFESRALDDLKNFIREFASKKN